jgi:hypothetical protein
MLDAEYAEWHADCVPSGTDGTCFGILRKPLAVFLDPLLWLWLVGHMVEYEQCDAIIVVRMSGIFILCIPCLVCMLRVVTICGSPDCNGSGLSKFGGKL